MNNKILKFLLYSVGIWVVREMKDQKNGAKKMNKDLPQFRGVLEVKHYLPGRIRFFMPMIKNNEEHKELLIQQLNRIKPIDSVRINTLTGTILITYKEEEITPMLLMGVLLKLVGLEDEVHKEPKSLVSKEIKNVKDSINLAIYDKTKGILDMKALLILVLISGGIYKCIKRPTVTPGGINYLWWAYSSMK